MHADCKHTLQEVALQLELDEVRGAPSLPARATSLRHARAAADAAAERQALIDLAAACVALAARLPAPRRALAESDRRPRTAQSRARAA